MKTFSLLKNYVRVYRRQLIVGLLALLAVDTIQIFVPWVIRHGIDLLSSGAATTHELLVLGALIIALAAGVGFTRFTWRYFIMGISRKIEEDLRNRFYRHLQTLSFSYYDHTAVGDLMAHATNDLEAVRMMCGMALVAGMDAAVLMIASLAMLFSIDLTLTCYILIPMPLVTLTILKLGPRLHDRFREVQAGFSDISQKAQETFAGIRVVKSYVQEQAESDSFRALNREYSYQNMKLVRLWGFVDPIITTVAGLCMVIILLIGGGKVIDGSMSVGDFVAFNSYLGILIWPMIAVGWVTNLYQRGKASLNRLNEIFDLKPEISDLPGAVSQQLHGRIGINNLDFSYEPTRPVITGVNLEIIPGQWVVFMGPTGAGKTTLINLLMRLYEPPVGAVYIDKIDVRQWQISSLRSQIGYVPQQTFLFSDSIRNNIAFGAGADDETILRVADIAQLTSDLALFPEGLDTIVGERGVMLSGGQKQRVAIARALIHHPPVIIFDDALSAVDTETETALIHALRVGLAGKTVLLVSHRVSLAQHADLIVFMEDGAVVERGTHEQLVALHGRYHSVNEYQKLAAELEQLDGFQEKQPVIPEVAEK